MLIVYLFNDLNSIVTRTVCNLYVGQCDQPFAKMKYTKDLKDMDNKIVECKYEDKQWKFMRERTDKSYPNSFNTAKGNYFDYLMYTVIVLIIL